jgi:hypothetical protein
MEILLYIVLAFGGYYIGKQDSVITTECRKEALIITNCTEIYPPKDDSFGETTQSYISLIDQYKKCKSACDVKVIH